MSGDYPWLFYLVAAVLLWLVRFREELAQCLRRSKPGALHTAATVPSQITNEIHCLANLHEGALALSDMIRHDGASTWPPTANHDHEGWPVALQGYKLSYLELASLLPRATASLDNELNYMAICEFRKRFRDLLRQHVDVDAVSDLFRKAENEKGIISGEVHNALWGVVPVVKVAQQEEVMDLPRELVIPWEYLQKYFGLTSRSGNVMSSLVLNFDGNGQHIFKSNHGLSEKIVSAEEEFARIFRDVEESLHVRALPIYYDMVRAIIAFETGKRAACLQHLSRIQTQLRSVLNIYYDRLHDQKIARSVWVSHVQGFLSWAAGYQDEQTGELVKFDGLSGNQILLFRALDAFLGMEPYLSAEDSRQNVPMRQREFCRVLRKHSIGERLDSEEDATEILDGFDKIVKRLRLFRSAHRTRSLNYLAQPTPERVPMTAGKSMLSSDPDQSLRALEEFLVTRLKQTV